MKLSRIDGWLVAAALALSAVGARAYALSCAGVGYVWTLEPVSVERLSGEADQAAEEARFLAPATLHGSSAQVVEEGGPEVVTLTVQGSDAGVDRASLTFARPGRE